MQYFPRIHAEDDDLLLMLDEVEFMWEVTRYQIYKAVRDGQLLRRRRPGYQAYYAFSDVKAWRGCKPLHPLPGVIQRAFEFLSGRAA